MASQSICASCLRALRQQARKELRSTGLPAKPLPRGHWIARPLSTSPPHRAQMRSAKPPAPHSSTPSSADLSQQLAASMRSASAFRSTTEPYLAYGGTEDLFRACTQQCDYTIPNVRKSPPQPAPQNAAGEDVGVGSGWWVAPKETGGLGLDVTFSTWAQVMFLHMYCLTVRLRCFPREFAGVWHQNLVDHFFYAAEDRMAVWHGMTARGTRNKYLKDMWLQWRGILLSYDEGLIRGDAVLATAVWRNMFKASEHVDLADVALVTAYLRRQLAKLDAIGDEDITSGHVVFDSPESVKSVLRKESPAVRTRFEER